MDFPCRFLIAALFITLSACGDGNHRSQLSSTDSDGPTDPQTEILIYSWAFHVFAHAAGVIAGPRRSGRKPKIR